jgi:hypothetical protein
MRRVYLFLIVLVWLWVPGLTALESEVLRRGKGSIEPVRCHMTGSLMTIHHCLKEKERFVLLLAGKKSVIYRQGGS